MKNKLVSYCLFTYNQEEYIEHAIAGALSQTYTPLEIIISDDCSKDSTYKIIEETVQGYKGPHTIVLNRNSKNLGLGDHVSKILYDTAKGDYLLTCAGDDISKPNHVLEAVKVIENDAIGNMVDFSGEIIDENGVFVKKIELPYQEKFNTLEDYLNLKKIELFAPGRIVSKKMLNHFEPLTKKCPTEDTVLVLRSLLLGGFTRVNKDLVSYRKHMNNISSKGGLSKLSNLAIIAQYIKDVLFLFETNMLDEETASILLKRINLEYKIRFLSFGKRKYKLQN
ncbi:hypothetical protein BTO15_08975, partial [Polaribacter sejongensis]